MADALDAKWEKLMVIMERLASQPAPTINVNVHMADGSVRRKRQPAQSGPISDAENPSEFPEPGGQPRPYVS